MSRLRILQNRQDVLAAGHLHSAGRSRRNNLTQRLERATGLEVRSQSIAATHIRALRIFEWNVRTIGAEEVAVIAFPLDITLRVFPRADNIRPSVEIHRHASDGGRPGSDRIQAARVAM